MVEKDEIYESKRYRIKKQNLRITMSIFLVFFILISVVTYRYVNASFSSVQGQKINEEDVGITQQTQNLIKQYGNDTKNILFVGIDEPEDSGGAQRSDSMMIFTIDSQNKTIKMSSLMRDVLVPIEGHGKDKLNHAYAYGGIQLSLKTINQAYDLNITDYVLVNFHNLIQIIDSIGGIDMDITELEIKPLNDAITDINYKELTSVPLIETPGVHHLNGTQATAYSRIRHAGPNDTDYARSARQRKVLKVIFNKLKETPVYKLPSTASAMSSFVKTSLSTDEMIELGSQIILEKITNIKETRFPTSNTSQEMNTPQLWYLKYDKEATVKEMHDFIFKDIQPKVETDN